MGLPIIALTEDDVITIWESNESSETLAAIYGASLSLIERIKLGKIYTNITENLVKPLIKVKTGRRARLTEEQVIFILTSDEPVTSLAGRFNVSNDTIHVLRKGLTWKHLSHIPRTPSKKFKSGKNAKKNSLNLTKEQVLEIVKLFPNHSNSDLAKMYNVKRATISGIRCGRTWASVTGGFKFPPCQQKLSDSSWVSKIFTEDDIRYIRKSDKLDRTLALEFKVNKSTIYKIKHYLSWKNVKDF